MRIKMENLNKLYYEKLVITKKITNRAVITARNFVIDEETGEIKTKEKKQKTYTINRKTIRERVFAWSDTEEFKRFSAFWTITFPSQIDNKNRGKILNIFLTRIRKANKDFTKYLWVAEKHKTGLIHYHLITTTFVKIDLLKQYLQASINTILKKKNNNILTNYNGIDVKTLKGDTKKVTNYITKYVTKNKAEFENLCWYCSKKISNLKTYIELTDYEIIQLTEYLELNKKDTFTIKEDFFTYYSIKHEKSVSLMWSVKNENEKILK